MAKKSKSERKDVYEAITEGMLEVIEKEGLAPWQKPWAGGMPKNLVSGKPYRGINVFILAMQPFGSAYWLTFKQAKARGGSVRKGEKGTKILFWRFVEKTDKETGEKERIPFARVYTVFNVEQCEGVEYPEHQATGEAEAIEECDRLVSLYADAPPIMHGGDRACYSPGKDEIRMPKRETFVSSEAYYGTLFHELGHSTGHGSRLNRDEVTNLTFFGSHSYSVEELVAEFTSAFLCGMAGIHPAIKENQAAYLKGWVSKLKDKPKWLVQAAQRAQKAADWVQGIKPIQKAQKADSEAAQAA